MNSKKFCSECGNKLDGGSFCSSCGAKVGKSISNTDTLSNNVNIKKCKYCKKDIELNASICPFCRRKQKSSVIVVVIIVILLIVIIGAGGNALFGTSELKIINDSGKCSGVTGYWEGDLVNNGNIAKENIRLTYTCYNANREVKGTFETRIKYIKPGETLHFNASGIVKCEKDLKCEYKIEANYKDKQ